MGVSGKTHTQPQCDDYSRTKNPEHQQHKDTKDNRANQLNPNNPNYKEPQK